MNKKLSVKKERKYEKLLEMEIVFSDNFYKIFKNMARIQAYIDHKYAP